MSEKIEENLEMLSSNALTGNIYGILCDFTKIPEFEKYRSTPTTGENLAAKLIFADRILRISWDGFVAVEYRRH